MNNFSIISDYKPSGDQQKAIDKIIEGLNNKTRSQMLLGITGSGKTFTMVNIIARSNRPTLIMAHNKTLAAQIYSEMKSIFPNHIMIIISLKLI